MPSTHTKLFPPPSFLPLYLSCHILYTVDPHVNPFFELLQLFSFAFSIFTFFHSSPSTLINLYEQTCCFCFSLIFHNFHLSSTTIKINSNFQITLFH